MPLEHCPAVTFPQQDALMFRKRKNYCERGFGNNGKKRRLSVCHDATHYSLATAESLASGQKASNLHRCSSTCARKFADQCGERYRVIIANEAARSSAVNVAAVDRILTLTKPKSLKTYFKFP